MRIPSVLEARSTHWKSYLRSGMNKNTKVGLVGAAGLLVGAIATLSSGVLAQSNAGTFNMAADSQLGVTCPNGLSNSNPAADSETLACAQNTTTTTVVPTTTTVAQTTTTVGPTTTTTVPASTGGGCQFLTHPGDAAAFCDNFSQGPSQGGRSGQLNPANWAVTRFVGDTTAQDMFPFPSTPVSACQSGVSSVTADNDILVCNGASGHSGQILTALSAQNYGFMSMRPRKAFNFASGGTVTFNVDAVTQGGLSWWPSVFITDQPTAGAEDSVQVDGLLPRNGIGFDFWGCPNVSNNGTIGGLASVLTYNNYVETNITSTSSVSGCYATTHGSLNHFEIQLSPTSVSVWASDAGGSNFKKIFSAPVNLGFSQGYVSFQANERAPAKYQTQFGITPTYANYYWSDLGFDGPAVNTGEVGYSVPDALTPDPNDGNAPNVGYGILNNPSTLDTCCAGGSETTFPSLSIPNVNLAGATAAYLTFDVSYVYINNFGVSNVALQYSLNGGPLQSPNPAPNPVAQHQCSGCPGAPLGGDGVSYVFPVSLASLVNGTNTVTFSVPNSNNSFPPVVTGVDLLTFTNAPSGIS
jgi:hypothetical protein